MPLSEEFVEKCKECFYRLERNARGEIATSQLQKALNSMGLHLSQREIDDICQTVDRNGTGTISYSEFLHIMDIQHLKSNIKKQEMLLAFVAMGGNDDKTGSVDQHRLDAVLNGDYGLNIDIAGLVVLLDEDGNGEIDFEEFCSLLSLADQEHVEAADP
eukprot:846923_1